MSSPEWEGLPAALRAEADALVLADNWFLATKLLFLTDSDERRMPLARAQQLVAERQRHLGDRIRRRVEPPRTPEVLIAEVEGWPAPPDAFEALWDGDTQGWMLELLAVTRSPRSERCLAVIRRGGDLRLFNGTVPPWPEAAEAAETGAALARHFGVPFHFPHPDGPELFEPRWWDTV